jgi:hypothetical protein
VVGEMARGTWNTPPGVIGFDQGHVGVVTADAIFVANVGDAVQLIGYTTGGGDTTSLAGAGPSTMIITQLSPNQKHENSASPITTTGVPADPPFAGPVSSDPDNPLDLPYAMIRRPGYPETFPPGETDPGA